MGLTDIVDNTKLAAGFFLLGRAADTYTTYQFVRISGIHKELNGLTRVLMETCGAGSGLALHNLIAGASVVAGAYVLNRAAERAGINCKLGNFFAYYFAGLTSLAAAVHNSRFI